MDGREENIKLKMKVKESRWSSLKTKEKLIKTRFQTFE